MKTGKSPASCPAAPSIGFQRMEAAIGIGRSSEAASTGSAPPGTRNRATLPCTPLFTRFHMRLPDDHFSGVEIPRFGHRVNRPDAYTCIIRYQNSRSEERRVGKEWNTWG